MGRPARAPVAIYIQLPIRRAPPRGKNLSGRRGNTDNHGTPLRKHGHSRKPTAVGFRECPYFRVARLLTPAVVSRLPGNLRLCALPARRVASCNNQEHKALLVSRSAVCVCLLFVWRASITCHISASIDKRARAQRTTRIPV